MDSLTLLSCDGVNVGSKSLHGSEYDEATCREGTFSTEKEQDHEQMAIFCEGSAYESELPPGPAVGSTNLASDAIADITTYCFTKIGELQCELSRTQEQLNATDAQLEITQAELDAAIHDCNHHKRMREHQQRVINQTLKAKNALEAKLDELESLLDTDLDRYVQFRQQTIKHIIQFEDELDLLKSELLATKQDNLLDKWKNLNLSDEIMYLTAINSLLKQKIAMLENQASQRSAQSMALLEHEKEVSQGHKTMIQTLEKQCVYFKNKYSEVERRCTKAQFDLGIMQDIIKGKNAKIKKLEEKQEHEREHSVIASVPLISASDRREFALSNQCILEQLAHVRKMLMGIWSGNTAIG